MHGPAGSDRLPVLASARAEVARRRVAPPDPARSVALDVMAAARERDAYVNLLLPALLGERGLGARDAAFATELAHGTIRMQGCYDAVLAAVVDRPLTTLEPAVLDVLRLGCHQLFSLRTPAHAAVSTSVDLVRRRVGARAVSFVNAVLRRVSARDLARWVADVAPAAATDPLGHLAVVHSHPRWIVEAMNDALAGDIAATAALLGADNVPAPVTLVARPGLVDVAELLRHGGGTVGSLSPYAVRLAGGDPAGLAPVRDGRAGVQDEGSQVVALAAAAASVEGRDARWLDLCAGPGGKAALLAALGRPRGAQVLANEVAPHRARLVAAALRRLPGAVVVGDGTRPAWPADTFDRVLVDAPCTGLGALRRRPEARWRRSPSDLPGLVALQRALLDGALDSVRPGGLVAYATCSPHLAETTQLLAPVVAGGDVEVLDAPAAAPNIPDQRGPYLQLWPHSHGTDAMFLALLRKR